MEQVINIIVQNGLGVGSFIALIFFMYTSLNDIKNSTEEISKTLLMIQTNLTNLQNRVERIEGKVDKDE